MNKKLFTAIIASLILGAATQLSASFIIAIGQNGGNDPVNDNNPRAWNFGVTEAGAAYFTEHGFTFDSAMFDAKKHKNTDAPLVFSLYSGLGGNINGNTLLTTIAMPSSEFDNQYGGGSGSLFTYSPQLFSMGYYSVTLTSTADDHSTKDYFLKQGKLELLDSNQTPVSSEYWIQDEGTGHATGVFNGTGSLYSNTVDLAMAPEPNAGWAVAFIATLSLGGAFFRRVQKTLVPAEA